MALDHMLGVAMLAGVNYFLIRPRLKGNELLVDVATAALVAYGVLMETLDVEPSIYVVGLLAVEVAPLLAALILSLIRKMQKTMSSTGSPGRPASVDF